ncbi:unnamed protein product [Arabidopsis lyrata]|uniref:uncharacterized protein LOC110228996 n=1 Tax=Arabidopsis lyrata subsp. lyrata TaxID=81972 RepID=UPI000A29B5D8|nr:uncharacterized protein LOC110228996 [Arabidopsis lyrata subsp. lyrata]CAH8265601.1 unnamed protein product [Arabidopsis lyrata]|eukprot:XP_020883294.1 uncharacterized protein LOC110228996 [Arabidopsis lyrata subsp. lyrata]
MEGVNAGRERSFRAAYNRMRDFSRSMEIQCNAQVALIAYSPDVGRAETYAFPGINEVMDRFGYEPKDFGMTPFQRYTEALAGVTGPVTLTQRTTEELESLRERLNAIIASSLSEQLNRAQ